MVDDSNTKHDDNISEDLEQAQIIEATDSEDGEDIHTVAEFVDAPSEMPDTLEDAGWKDGSPMLSESSDEPLRIPSFLQTGTAQPPTPLAEAQEIEPAQEQGSSPVGAVGSFFSEGAAAVREVSAARKAHAEAREQLEQLEATIADGEAELSHRREVAENYSQIIAEQTARRERAAADGSAAISEQNRIKGEIEALKERLQQMKDADSQTEKRLKAALEAAEARETSSRESGARLQRRLDDAKRNLDKAEEDQKSGLKAARAAVESANARLAMLRDEYAEVQRNPSANSAAYSVRADELQAEISDAAHELQSAKDDLPRIADELADALAYAKKAMKEAEKPIDEAKKSFHEVSAAADEARNAYRDAKDDAAERQRKLREEISGKEKERRAQEQAAEDARAEERDAQALIDEANDIHAHPDVTETIAARLEADRAEREQQAAEVEGLASAEQAVRERTRGSRTKFIGALAAIAAAVIVVFVLIAAFVNQ